MEVDSMYNRYVEYNHKFDYFMVGLSTAVLAYSVQSFDSGNYNKYIFCAPIAWVFLLLAVIAGTIKIQIVINILKDEPLLNRFQAELKELKHSMLLSQEGNPCAHNPNTLREYTQEEISTLMKKSEKSVEEIEQHRRNLFRKAEKLNITRQWFLLLGLLFLGFLKTVNL